MKEEIMFVTFFLPIDSYITIYAHANFEWGVEVA